MSNQIEILMLIEELESRGFHVLSGNTDGVTVLYHKSKDQEFKEICSWWEEKVGNTVLGKLEDTEFKCVWQESVNHYLALKPDGSVKKKGSFATSFPLNKTKNSLVVKLAVEAYFVNGVNPEEFIKNHPHIHDFLIAKKASRGLFYVEIDPETGEVIKTHKKLVRYYVSNHGTIFKKRGVNFYGDQVDQFCEAPNSSYPFMGQPLCSYFNRNIRQESYDINYSFYILAALEKIDKIQRSKLALNYVDQFRNKQLSLF